MVELIVAMFVIGMVLVLLIGIQISAARTIVDSRYRQEATALANEAVEQMRAIPWNVLAKGMDAQFLAAAGGDPYVSAGKLSVDGITYNLVIANTTQDQDTTKPWPPLFSSTGSNKQSRVDPSGQHPFTIRGYVTQPIAGSTTSLGIAVVVEWMDAKGKPSHTTIWSSAYRGGGCDPGGRLDTAPFLGACQALLDSSSSSGQIISEFTASTVDNGVDPVTPLPILGPTVDPDVYLLSMRTAGVAATASSQQTVVTRAIAQYGGTTFDDALAATQPGVNGWENGYALYELGASDDVTSPELPNNPTDLVISPSGGAESPRYIDYGNSPVRLWAYSDFRRSATLDASTTISCMTGIPIKQPCAKASIGNYPDLDGGSGYMLMQIEDPDNTIFRLSRRLSESGSNDEVAWAGRFITSPGTSAAVGCTTLTAEGCVSAGAERKMADLHIGNVVTGKGNWDGEAPNGLVIVDGQSGCAFTGGLYESIVVQRGASQATTSATAVRCGRVQYWTGSGYTSLALTKDTETVLNTTEVTWTSGDYTVVAQAVVSISRASVSTSGVSPCATDACFISADAGVISINASYTITWPSGSYVLESVTVINPPQATASYRKAPSA